jgi:hypothetical protein
MRKLHFSLFILGFLFIGFYLMVFYGQVSIKNLYFGNIFLQLILFSLFVVILGAVQMIKKILCREYSLSVQTEFLRVQSIALLPKDFVKKNKHYIKRQFAKKEKIHSSSEKIIEEFEKALKIELK